jgi:thymidylate kinase
VGLHICVLGIDGSGKSTVSERLPAQIVKKLQLSAGMAGDSFFVAVPGKAILHRDRMAGPMIARLFRRWAKRCVNSRRLYPVLKLVHLLLQDAAARSIAKNCRLPVTISDGNAVLSAVGRSVNYLPAFPAESGPISEAIHRLFCRLVEGRRQGRTGLPGIPWFRRIKVVTRWLGKEMLWLPDGVIFLYLDPELALARIVARGKPLDRHERLSYLREAQEMYFHVVEAFSRYRSESWVLRLDVGRSPTEVTVERIVTFIDEKLRRAG